MRGAGANQCLILLDGQRLNSPAGGGVDLSKIPLSQVERIDIIRGSDSALFGESAMGGIVNIVTKDPSGKPAADASLTYGSYETWDGSVNGSSPLGKYFGITANVGGRKSDSDFKYINNNGTEYDEADDFEDVRRNNAYEEFSCLGKVNFKTDMFSAALSGAGSSSDKQIPGIITNPTPNAWQNFIFNSFNLDAGMNAGKLDVNLNAGRVWQHDKYRDPDAPLFSDTLTTTWQGNLTAAYPLGPVRIRPGISYLDENMDDNQAGEHDRTTGSGFLGAEYSPWQFDLSASLRYDDPSSYQGKWLYRLGAVWNATDYLKVKANLGTGYRIPSFYELYYNHEYIVGNPDLVPESSLSFDIGPVLELEKLSISLDYFDQRYTDQIIYVLQSGLYYKPYNDSRSKAQGIELSISYMPFEWCTLSGNYTYNRAVDTSGDPNRDGCQIPGQPRNIANVQADFNFMIRQIGFGAWASYNYTEGNFVTWANTKKLPDRNIYNAGIKAGPYKHLSLSAEVKNLTDEKAVDLRGFPLEGRAYYATASMSF
jgi:outer membrane cobalamin receptor